MTDRKQLSPTQAYYYVALGHGTFTLVGLQTRYTFKLTQKENETGDRSPIFVSLLTGPQNETDYHYIGFIPARKQGSDGIGIAPMQLVAGRKGNPNHPAFIALNWWLNAYRLDNPKIEMVEFWHEGTCGHCGRKLTTPESIERGIGPKCAERLH